MFWCNARLIAGHQQRSTAIGSVNSVDPSTNRRRNPLISGDVPDEDNITPDELISKASLVANNHNHGREVRLARDSHRASQ